MPKAKAGSVEQAVANAPVLPAFYMRRVITQRRASIREQYRKGATMTALAESLIATTGSPLSARTWRNAIRDICKLQPRTGPSAKKRSPSS